jgi:hypothetical protein
MSDPLNLQAVRLERQTMLWATGQRWSDDMDSWAAKIEAAWRPKTGRSPAWAGG